MSGDSDIGVKPYRLKNPSPIARGARSVLEDGFAIPDTTPIIRLVPVVQWHQMRLRLRITGAAGVVGVQFARPERQRNPAVVLTPFLYTAAQPAVNGTAWVTATELALDITGVEHHGENWLQITLTAAGACVVDFIDISGDLHGMST